jgi:hypothetical protein
LFVELPKRSVMSPVAAPASLGTLLTADQVFPPSLEAKIGALAPPKGFGVKAEAAMRRVLDGFTAMFGSLSWLDSPLNARGMMLTTRIIVISSTYS